jgi:hypothetical protein
MVSTMVKGDIIHIFCPLSDALICMSYVGSKRGRKPWVMAVQTVFSMALCLCTNYNIMVGLWIYPPYSFDCAMEVFSSNRYRFVWPLIMHDPPKASSGVPALDCVLQGLVRISAVLLSAEILFLRVWLGRKRLELPPLQLPYLALCLSLTLCLAQVASMDIPLLRRSVEFSYDQEAQGTVRILGGFTVAKKPGDKSRVSEIIRGSTD